MPDPLRCVAIGVGGSGARAAESLLYLCAAGLGPDSLTLILVDAHTEDKNVIRAKRLAELYTRLQSTERDQCPLFATKVTLLNPSVSTPLAAGDQTNFDSFFDYAGLSARTSTRSLGKVMEFLHPEDCRRADLGAGFLGSATLAATLIGHGMRKEVQPWTDLISSLRSQASHGQQVSVFMFGSVFGATGAGGLSVLPRFLHESINAPSSLCLGAALLLPYFSFTPTDAEEVAQGPLRSSPNEFLIKSKEVLWYLDTCNNLYNRLYLLGSHKPTVQKSSDGDHDQAGSPPHFVELLAASGAMDFFRYAKPTDRTIHVAESASEEVFRWSDHPDEASIRPALANLARMCFFFPKDVMPRLSEIRSNVSRARRTPWYRHLLERRGVTLTEESDWSFFADINLFAKSFLVWLRGVQDNRGDWDVQLADTRAFADLTLDSDRPKTCGIAILGQSSRERGGWQSVSSRNVDPSLPERKLVKKHPN